MIHWVWVAWPFTMKIQPYNYQKKKGYNYQKNKQHLKLKEMECQLLQSIQEIPDG